MPCNNDYNVDDLINSIQILSTVDSKNNYVILDFDFKIVFVNDNFRNFLDNVFYLKNNKIISQIKMDISQKRLKSYPVIIQSNIYILQISSLQNNLYLVNFSRYTTYNLHYRMIKNFQHFFTKISDGQKNLLLKLTDYQILICYLLTYNYPNEEIARICTLVTGLTKTRSAINRRIEKLRISLDSPSKANLIQLLLIFGIQNRIPKLLINHFLNDV